MSQQEWFIVLAVIIVAVILLNLNQTEGYSSRTAWLSPEKDDYYLWRAFGPNNADEVKSYPWNRQHRPHFSRFNWYSTFLNGGYGHL